MILFKKIASLFLVLCIVFNGNISIAKEGESSASERKRRKNPKYSEFKETASPIAPGKSRIIFYKDADFLDPWGASVKLNGQKIGRLNQGRFYSLDILPGIYLINFGTTGENNSLFVPEGEQIFVNIYYIDRGNGVLDSKVVEQEIAERKISKYKYQSQKDFGDPTPKKIWLDDSMEIIMDADKYHRENQTFLIKGFNSLKANRILISNLVDLRKENSPSFEGFLSEYDLGDRGIKLRETIKDTLENRKNYFCELSNVDYDGLNGVGLAGILDKISSEYKGNSQWVLFLGVTGLGGDKNGDYNNVDLISVLVDKRTKDILMVNYAYLDMENIKNVFLKKSTGSSIGLIGAAFDSLKDSVHFELMKQSLFSMYFTQHIPDNSVLEIE